MSDRAAVIRQGVDYTRVRARVQIILGTDAVWTDSKGIGAFRPVLRKESIRR